MFCFERDMLLELLKKKKLAEKLWHVEYVCFLGIFLLWNISLHLGRQTTTPISPESAKLSLASGPVHTFFMLQCPASLSLLWLDLDDRLVLFCTRVPIPGLVQKIFLELNIKELNLGKGILKFYFSLRKISGKVQSPWNYTLLFRMHSINLVGRKAWAFKKCRIEKKILYIFKKLNVYQY